MIIKIGIPPFPAKLMEIGTLPAKIERVWHSARPYARENGYDYVSATAPLMMHRRAATRL